MSRFSSGRDYYSSAMEGSDVTTPFWTEGDQTVIYPAGDQATSLAKFGLGVGAIGLLGKVSLGNGERVWDKYMGAIRAFEEYTPARLGRTFQLSHILSPTESLSRQTRYLSPSILRELRRTPAGQTWVEHLANVIGNERVFSPGSRVMEEGLRFESGKLFYGRSSDVLLEHAGVIRSLTGVTPFDQEGYARSLAGRDFGDLRGAFTLKIPFETTTGERVEEISSFVGGKSRRQQVWRGFAGWGTAAVERFNRLIQSPGEFLPSSIAKYAEKIGSFLTVKPSSGLKTLGAISLKLGVGLPAAYFAYDLADWSLRKLGTPGITGMVSNLITSGQRVTSSIAEITGGHAYRERQEEIAPGSTDLTRLMAFPMMGLIGGATANYVRNVAKQVAFQRAGYSLADAALIVQSEKHQMIKSLYGTKIPEFLSKAMEPKTLAMVEAQSKRALETFSGTVARRIALSQQGGGLGGKVLSVLGKVTPTKLKSIIGAGIGLALVAPFIPGALVPSKRPEELARIQSGQQLVPIRRGRWWELGRSSWEGGRIDRFIPNWNVRIESNARDIGVYGEDLPAIAKFWKENFTYDIEERNYFTRPYPITGAAFENVPFVGPILAATVGRLFKPPRLMHTEDMYNEQGQIREMPLRSGERGPISGLGEKGAGMPLNPYGAKNTISESVWRMREMVGLWGWLPGAIKENITGTEGIFDQETRLQSASEMYSLSRDFYEEELGGMAGCFIKGTIVKTLRGNIPIEEITTDDLILNDNGFYKVRNIFINHLRTPLVKVNIGSFGLTFTSTINHKIPIVRRHCYNSKSNYKHPKPFKSKNIDRLEVQVGDLLPDDLVYYPIDQTEQEHVVDLVGTGKYSTDKYVYLKSSRDFALAYEAFENNSLLTRNDLRNKGLADKHIKEALRQFRHGPVPLRIDRFVPVSEDLAYIIGWYIAEGSIDKGRITYVMHANEIVYAEEILKIFNKLGYNGSIKINKNTLVLRVNASCLSRYFATFGQESHVKHIPSEYKHLPRSILRRLVSGLILGDGWQKDNSWQGGFTSVSKQLVLDLVDCLLKLGTSFHLNLDYLEKTKGNYPQGTPKHNILRHYLRINQGRESWRFFKNSYLLPVQSITTLENNEECTYDLEIEDNHYYTVNGILVHNSNEAFRRLFPRDRRIPAWNAIPNAFQDIWWMPGAGSRSPDFKTGDPYRLIEHGEYRLPGPGYDILHPELAGVNPNDWPAIARYRMLADIAPYSEEYQEVKAHVTSMKRAGHLTPEELEEVGVIANQIEQRKTGKRFHEYRYGERSRTEVQTVLAAANEASKEDKPSGFFESVLGRYWETLSHNAETPFEFLTPVSPASKFVHMRSAIEDYEKAQLYGSEMAFWQNPIRDFIRPFIESTKHALGWNGIPAQVQERREIEDYFDALEYIKFTRLHTAAQEAGDQEAEGQFEERRRETLTGVNPYTRRYTQVFRALPRRERDYFNSFVKADLNEQKKILDMVPENEKSLYLARWQMENADAIKKATKQGLLSDRQIQESQAEVTRLYEDMDTEGLPKTTETWAEYLGTRMRGESYPDWYRRTKLLEEKLAGKALPGPDWVGWNPAVSLEDVKLKVVQNLGHPPTEYDIWPDQQRMASRRPYLEEAVQELEKPLDRSLIRARIQQVLDANNIKADMINITPLAGTESRQIDLRVVEDRENDIREIIRRKGTG